MVTIRAMTISFVIRQLHEVRVDGSIQHDIRPITLVAVPTLLALIGHHVAIDFGYFLTIFMALRTDRCIDRFVCHDSLLHRMYSESSGIDSRQP